jgi:pyridoxine/pyridoxamine 5'-phosphate oxidase
MRETAADLLQLQALLDRSIERASPFLRSSFEMPERSLSAAALGQRLEGMLTVSLATVTASGEPRVAPIDAVFLRGNFYVPTVAQAARARQLARRPAVSLTYYEGRTLAVIVHGRAEVVRPDEEPFEEVEEVRIAEGGQAIVEWAGDPIFLRIIPDLFYSYEKEM